MARVVITGANRGIGLALARVYATRGDQVVAACRKTSPELAALPVEVQQGVDVSSDSSVEAFAKAIGTKPIDILVNNAAIHVSDSLGHIGIDGIRRQFDVNAVGPIRVTRALLPRFHGGSKVAIITSRSGSIGDNGSGGNYGYRMSKAALNMAAVNLAIDLKPRGIVVALLHPGMVRTGMGSGPGAIDPELSARRLVQRIDEATLEKTATFLHAEGHALPW